MNPSDSREPEAQPAPKQREETTAPPSPQFVQRRVTIRRRAITHLEIVEVLEHELDDLAEAYSQTHQALTVATGLGGITLACVLSMITSWSSLDPRWLAVLAGLALTSFVLALWFLLRWNQARKQGPRILARIRSRQPEVWLEERLEEESRSSEKEVGS